MEAIGSGKLDEQVLRDFGSPEPEAERSTTSPGAEGDHAASVTSLSQAMSGVNVTDANPESTEVRSSYGLGSGIRRNPQFSRTWM